MSSLTARRLGNRAAGSLGGGAVNRVDGAYLYDFGAKCAHILRLPEQDTSLIELYFILNPAREAVNAFVFSSVFSGSMKTLVSPANKLVQAIDQLIPASGPGAQVDWEQIIHGWRISGVKNAFRNFEAVLIAEMQTAALYHVPTKGGFDTACLTDFGEALFPSDLGYKVPGAVVDVKAGARCLAFDLHTAAGFHFHRANEAVLRTYFDNVAGSQHRPKTRNMGDYLNKMEKLGVGDAKVIGVLKSLKDLHRNPLMHPEDIIANLDEALSLYAAVRAAIGYMLDRIPIPALSLGAAVQALGPVQP